MLKVNVSQTTYHHDADRARALCLSKLVERWDETIQQALDHLAHTLWPPKRMFGLVSRKNYTACAQHINSLTYMWWVEQATPNREGRYAAYGVKLTLDALGQPVLTVQSGDTTYPLPTMTAEALEATLALARQDTPMIVCRDEAS